MTQHHILEDFNFQLHSSENLESYFRNDVWISLSVKAGFILRRNLTDSNTLIIMTLPSPHLMFPRNAVFTY